MSFFQLIPVVASSRTAMEPSPPLSTPAFILLPSTASGPSRFATLLPLTAPPPLPETPLHTSSSPPLLLHPQPAMRAMLRQHYRSQAVQYLFYLHLSDCCCCCSSSWAAVFCVLVLFAGVCVCVCATCATYIKGFSKRLPREPTISPSVQNAWPRKSCKKHTRKHMGWKIETHLQEEEPRNKLHSESFIKMFYAISLFCRSLFQMQHFTPRWSRNSEDTVKKEVFIMFFRFSESSLINTVFSPVLCLIFKNDKDYSFTGC